MLLRLRARRRRQRDTVALMDDLRLVIEYPGAPPLLRVSLGELATIWTFGHDETGKLDLMGPVLTNDRSPLAIRVEHQ